MKGLGDYTHLELIKLNLINNKFYDIYEYLYKLESKLLSKASECRSMKNSDLKSFTENK